MTSEKMKSTKICVRLWFRLSTNRFLFTRPENQIIPILYHPCSWIKIYTVHRCWWKRHRIERNREKIFPMKNHRRKDFQLIQLPSLFSFVSVSAMLIRRSQYICGTLPQESRKKTRNSLSFHIMDVSSNRLYYCQWFTSDPSKVLMTHDSLSKSVSCCMQSKWDSDSIPSVN